MKTWTCGDAMPADERPYYLDHQGERLYVVQHRAASKRPRASVVLAGPMTLERSHGYLTWVRWARNLALNGYDVYRFDYRGVGESSGDFRTQSFDAWQEDLAAVVTCAKAQRRGRVVVLGLRLGALVGRRVFDSHLADAFIAWDPPASGKAMLMDMMRRKLAADYMEFGGERKTRDEYVRELEAGHFVEVEGYHWSKTLWRSAEPFTFAEPERIAGEWFVSWLDGRPAEKLPNTKFYTSHRIPKPPFWLQSAHLVADLSELFTSTLERLHAWSDAWSVSDVPEELPAQSEGELAGGSRRLEVLELSSGRCVGTQHVPARRESKVGLLWVNFGYVPRDGHGGLAAQVSDVLARDGVPCFRFDLPGLGDAPGALPAHTHQFFPVVTGGAFTAVTTELVRTLCAREGLEGMVVGGLCGGAVNTIFTADAQKDLVKGVLLLEPEMYVTEPKGEEDEKPRRTREWLRERLPKGGGLLTSMVDRALAAHLPFEDQVRETVLKKLPVKQLRAKLFSYWGWMRLLTDENQYARFVPLPKKALLDFVLSRSELPSVTNLPLAYAWQRWVKEQRPALIITADHKLREVFFDRINDKVLSGLTKLHYEHVRLKGTNHIFTTGGAIATVTSHIERGWSLFERAL